MVQPTMISGTLEAGDSREGCKENRPALQAFQLVSIQHFLFALG
ncbi:MAG: hypothetical protein AVDCRST_MAG58-3519 [uncultured Rubrobacteraceae bacterium]|uniref:Uncharacterized protein n=1 Tax=uncultured Rubrobacteraceae bacterium TaxID=349277 RepID=A0A6J4R8Z9_9ACTN|nr:MAG: hypothetical protein AVDCRST_MAG58-3519 [uncultured Rubrobacteraceae bacterium]